MNTNRKTNFTILLLLLVGLSGLEPALAQEVQVKSADPVSAVQGTVNLDVTITGKGFDNSAQVSFLVTNTANPGGIIVNSVQVRGPKKLIANINIAIDAEDEDFDIEVEMLQSGRKGKGTTLFKVNQVGGGNVDPTYDVTISVGMSGRGVSGTGEDWPVENSGIDSISYFSGFQGQTGVDGFIDLSYFTVPKSLDPKHPFTGGPFSGDRGEKCFGSDFPVPLPLKAGSLEQRTDLSAYAHFTIYGWTDDGQTELQYHLDMTGPIDYRDDWPPQMANSMNLVTWKLLLGANKYKKYANNACLGESVDGEGFLTIIEVVRTPD